MKKIEKINAIMDAMENEGYGLVAVDTANENRAPYQEYTTESQMLKITAMYFVEMSDELFENGIIENLDELDETEYIKIEIRNEK